MNLCADVQRFFVILIMIQQNYFVYITTNPSKEVLYTGVTNDLEQRLTEHYLNKGEPAVFAGKFYCYGLLYYERYTQIKPAIKREKQIKSWRREKKENLIGSLNPDRRFLNNEIMKWPPDKESMSR
jgi:putative endonuclease